MTKFFEILLIYLDDILIFSKTVEEQLERLEFVFQRLRQHGLKLKVSFLQEAGKILRTRYFTRWN